MYEERKDGKVGETTGRMEILIYLNFSNILGMLIHIYSIIIYSDKLITI